MTIRKTKDKKIKKILKLQQVKKVLEELIKFFRKLLEITIGAEVKTEIFSCRLKENKEQYNIVSKNIKQFWKTTNKKRRVKKEFKKKKTNKNVSKYLKNDWSKKNRNF